MDERALVAIGLIVIVIVLAIAGFLLLPRRQTIMNMITYALSLIAVVVSGAAVEVSKSNPYHLQEAVGLLTAQDCLACHNGMTGVKIVICTGNECLYSKNHSLLKRYPPSGKEGDYAPLSTIEAAGCMLEGGKITCLSCHDLTKPGKHLIREGDQLCKICHLAQ